jgi:hypothetical protein
LKVRDVVAGSDPRHWAIFERQRLIHKHIGEHGMINPIVVNSKNELQFGGCRFQYAVLNDWDKIPAVVVDDLNEVRRLQKEMAKMEYGFLPEQYIEIKDLRARVAQLEEA